MLTLRESTGMSEKLRPDCNAVYAASRNLGIWCSLSCHCILGPKQVEHLRDTGIVLLLIQISFVFLPQLSNT